MMFVKNVNDINYTLEKNEQKNWDKCRISLFFSLFHNPSLSLLISLSLSLSLTPFISHSRTLSPTPALSLSLCLPHSHTPGGTLLTLLSKFATCVSNSVDGKGSTDGGVEMSELYGGARISYIFNEVSEMEWDSEK